METIILQDKKLQYHQILTIWEGFCHRHKELYDLSCEEYLTLLASDIHKLETMIPIKEEIIAKIGELEIERTGVIEKLNNSGIFPHPINSSSELVKSFAEIDEISGVPALSNLNALLIDIIEKIQEQNKKNQMFLNKAMLSIREIKQGFSGKKSYATYGADGLTRTLDR
jgi:flagellar biosynthesis/type III secretory pathway chaperone